MKDLDAQVSLDGAYDVEPILVKSFNIHLTERYDVILCADQEPGNYLINATYDYACALTPGHFIPPGFGVVPTCHFFAFLHYAGADETPRTLEGTGGGLSPKDVSGVDFDLTLPSGWKLTRPLAPRPEPEKADYSYTVNLGILAPVYEGPTDRPLAKGRWFMDLADEQPPRTWAIPKTPLYHTKGTCGVSDIPILNVPEDARTVEIVVQNLSPNAHVLHMHGMPFKVINVGDVTDWCGIDSSSCFLLPYQSPFDLLNKCPKHLRTPGDPNASPTSELSFYWGIETKHLHTKPFRRPLTFFENACLSHVHDTFFSKE